MTNDDYKELDTMLEEHIAAAESLDGEGSHGELMIRRVALLKTVLDEAVVDSLPRVSF